MIVSYGMSFLFYVCTILLCAFFICRESKEYGIYTLYFINITFICIEGTKVVQQLSMYICLIFLEKTRDGVCSWSQPQNYAKKEKYYKHA